MAAPTKAFAGKSQKRSHPESILQRQAVKWFRFQYPRLLLYANPNGGKRSEIEAAIMQGEGVLAGVPDLFLACPSGQWAGLYLELKILPNQPTPVQRQVMDQLVKAGYACQVIYTLEQFIEAVNHYLSLPS